MGSTSLSLYLSCLCLSSNCHQPSLAELLPWWRKARSELMGSEVFLQSVFCTFDAVTGSETKETTTNAATAATATTPTATADASSSSSSKIATRSRPLREFKSRPLLALLVFSHGFWLLECCTFHANPSCFSTGHARTHCFSLILHSRWIISQ